MSYNDGCSRRRRVALGLATIWLSGCATVGSDGGGPGACPPVVGYSNEFQARAAEELALLPEGSAIAEMMADYAVMREKARASDRFVSSFTPRWKTLNIGVLQHAKFAEIQLRLEKLQPRARALQQ